MKFSMVLNFFEIIFHLQINFRLLKTIISITSFLINFFVVEVNLSFIELFVVDIADKLLDPEKLFNFTSLKLQYSNLTE